VRPPGEGRPRGDFRGIINLASTIQEGALRHLLPAARAALCAGEPVRFGSLEVTREGLDNGKELLPWAEVLGVSVDPVVYRVKVHRKGVARAWIERPVPQFPNLRLFAILVEAGRRGSLSDPTGIP
jgi:hypothetical protein